MISAAEAHVNAALRIADTDGAAPFEKSQMLVEIAMGLQTRPRAPADFEAAIALYEHALRFAADEPTLEHMRIRARMATALSMNPQADMAATRRARALLEQALPVLHAEAAPAEWAEAELNLGLTLQALAGSGAASIGEAVAAYQRALKVFQPPQFVAEFAILHNNLATAYLARGGSGSSPIHEALAVQSFEAALKHVDKNRNPREYAMLQNNLGNALQHAASGHPLENHLRAVEAYEEALQIRTERSAPREFANTLANFGLCLSKLPADSVDGEPRTRARQCWEQAERVFRLHGEHAKADLVADNLRALDEPGV